MPESPRYDPPDGAERIDPIDPIDPDDGPIDRGADRIDGDAIGDERIDGADDRPKSSPLRLGGGLTATGFRAGGVKLGRASDR